MSGTLRLRGSTSGYSELQAPAVAADQTFVLPTAGGTLLTTDSPVPKLTLELGSASQPSLTFQGDTDTGLFSEGTNTLNLVTGGSSKVVLGAAAHTIYAGTGATVRAIDIDSSGRLLVGTSSARDNIYNNLSGVANHFQIEGTGYTDSAMIIVRNSNNANDGGIVIGKTRGTAVGSNTIVQDNDTLGEISFQGADGSGLVSAVEIKAEIDGTPGNNVMPGALTFSTNGGTTSPTERMRIDSSGKVGIGTTSPVSTVDCKGQLSISNNATSYWLFDRDDSDGRLKLLDSSTSTNERLAVDTSGRLLVGTSSNTDNYTFQVDSSTGNVASFTRYGADGATVVIGSARGTQGSKTALNVNDYGGLVTFKGYDGSNFQNLAWIGGVCDGQSPAPSDSPGRLVFHTTPDGSSTPTERMRITSDAYVRLASGTGGIQFGGDTAAANALDDYEEGTWTPALAGSVTAGTYENNLAVGFYRKIGDIVYFNFRFQPNNSVTGGGSGFMIMTGLPFTIRSAAGSYTNNVSAVNVAYMYRVPITRSYATWGPSQGTNQLLLVSYEPSSAGAINQSIELISSFSSTGTDRIMAGGGFYIAA